jgi:hypothetical protein
MNRRIHRIPVNHPVFSGKNGSATVVVLLVLMAVTVFGVLSIQTGLVELGLVRNVRSGRRIFYQAESAALEGLQRMADSSDIDREEQIAFWHHPSKEVKASGVDFRKPEDWIIDGGDEDNAYKSGAGEACHVAVVEWRLATGSSAVVTDTRMYLNRIYGRSEDEGHTRIVEIGYYMRY